MRTKSTWFEAKLDRVLAEAGTKMTDSMMMFIDGATNELWNHWDKFIPNPNHPDEQARAAKEAEAAIAFRAWLDSMPDEEDEENEDEDEENAGNDTNEEHENENTNEEEMPGRINPFPNPPWEYNGPTDIADDYRQAIIISPDNIKFGVQIVPSMMGSGIEVSYPGGRNSEEWDEEWGIQPTYGNIAIDPSQYTSKEHLREIIAHEVAHLVDPKERRIKGTGIDRKRESEERKYYHTDYQRQSHEVDAIMTSLADRRLREIMTPDATPADIQNAIRNIQPKHDFERNLLKNGQWKRYLQTIYRFAQQRQQA